MRGHPTALFAKPGYCKRTSHRANGIGGRNGDANVDGDKDGAGRRMRVNVNEGKQDGNGSEDLSKNTG